jgi:hypothetical protein
MDLTFPNSGHERHPGDLDRHRDAAGAVIVRCGLSLISSK